MRACVLTRGRCRTADGRRRGCDTWMRVAYSAALRSSKKPCAELPRPTERDPEGSAARHGDPEASHLRCSQARSRRRLRSGMAKLIYVANVSLDGYIEDAHGRFEWTAPTDEVHLHH